MDGTPLSPVSRTARSARSDSLPFSPAAVAFPTAVQARDVDRRVRAWRAARIAFGAGLVTGGLSLPFDALADRVLDGELRASTLLVASWGLAAVASLVTLVLAWMLPMAGRIGDRFLIASWAWPLAGLSLVLPLSLHALFIAGTGEPKDLDSWAAMSWALVGHCHVALAGMSIRRIERLAHGERALTPAAIFGITVGLAMVPGAIFLLIPPILVALTGLPFLFLLWLPEWNIARERGMLGMNVDGTGVRT